MIRKMVKDSMGQLVLTFHQNSIERQYELNRIVF